MQGCYSYFLILQFIMLTSLICYEIFSHGKHPYHLSTFLIEFIITYGFITEILIRLVYNKTEFFQNKLNILDFIMIILLGVIFGVSFKYSTHECILECTDFFPLGLLTARYLLQLIRIFLNFKRVKTIKRAASLEFCFQNLKDEEEEKLFHGLEDDL